MPTEKVKKELHAIQREARKKAASFIMAGFGLVVGLAWNDTIKAFIAYFFPLNGSGLIAQFMYAILLTLIVVIISMYLVTFLAPEEESKSK